MEEISPPLRSPSRAALVYRPWRRWWSLVLLLFSILLPLGGFMVWFYPQLPVKTVRVLGVDERMAKLTEEVVWVFLRRQASFAGKPNLLLVSRELLEEEILSRFPLVQSVKVERLLPGLLKITLTPKKPELIFYSGKRYYYVDRNGFAFAEVSFAHLPGVDLPIAKIGAGEVTVQLGSRILSPSFVSFVRELQSSLPRLTKLQIATLTIPSVATRELTVQVNEGWRILFDTERSPIQQIQALVKVLAEVIPRDERSKLEYLDLRVPRKVYYRFRK
jgi:cell division septal protein FtsQ